MVHILYFCIFCRFCNFGDFGNLYILYYTVPSVRRFNSIRFCLIRGFDSIRYAVLECAAIGPPHSAARPQARCCASRIDLRNELN